jgi:hypothetical protein
MFIQEDVRRQNFGTSAGDVGRKAVVAVGFVAGLVACFVAGWGVTRMLPDPNERLIENLPVVEHLEEYQAVRDARFLDMLRDAQYMDLVDVPVMSLERQGGVMFESAQPPPPP